MAQLLLLYLFLINAVSFLLMLADKQKARKNLWRIPERILFLSALLGGSVGAIAGMYTFRHKTRHLSFTLGMPAILAGQVGLAIYLLVVRS